MLPYNAGVWGMTGSETDVFHQKQLHSLIGVHWPQRISNLKLYEWCQYHQISTYEMDMQWRLFGHILRLDKEVLTNQAMSAYFQMACD